MPIGSTARDFIDTLRRAYARLFTRTFSLYLTFEGWCLVAAMLLIGFAAINTGAPLLYLVFSMLCAFFVINAFLATNTMKGLRPRRNIPRVWYAQTPLSIQLAIANSKRRTASFSLRMHDHTPSGALIGSAFFERIAPRGEARQEYQCVFPRRGTYRIERFEISSRFPFGLIERTVSVNRPEEILILPQSIPLDREMRRARVDLGDNEASRIGPGAGIFSFRDYTPDFSSRDIHWKVSARRGKLMVREYESEEKRRASVILDNRADEEARRTGGETFEKAIILAASVLTWLCENDHEVELRTVNGRIEFGTGPAHLMRCKRALATLQMVAPGEGDERNLAPSEPGTVDFVLGIWRRLSSGDGIVAFNVIEFDAKLAEAMRRDASLEILPGEQRTSSLKVNGAASAPVVSPIREASAR